MPRSKTPRKSLTAKKPPLTHFLCLPLVTEASNPQLEASTQAFRDDVTAYTPSNESMQSSRVHPKSIRPESALHCTLGVMSLSKDQLAQAIEVLHATNVMDMLSAAEERQHYPLNESEEPSQEHRDRPGSLTRPILPPNTQSSKPLCINLKGLESMHAPENTSILYTAPEDPSQRLYAFCLALRDLFKQANLLVPDDRPLKLHATIVNTIYAKGRRGKRPPKVTHNIVQTREGDADDDDGQDDRSQGHGPDADAPLKIDARLILEKYRDFFWAKDVVLDRFSICEMGAKKRYDVDGKLVGEEYTEVASVRLPS